MFKIFANFAVYYLYKFGMIETKKPSDRAILIGIIYNGQDESEVEDFLDELAFLTETAEQNR